MIVTGWCILLNIHNIQSRKFSTPGTWGWVTLISTLPYITLHHTRNKTKGKPQKNEDEHFKIMTCLLECLSWMKENVLTNQFVIASYFTLGNTNHIKKLHNNCQPWHTYPYFLLIQTIKRCKFCCHEDKLEEDCHFSC